MASSLYHQLAGCRVFRFFVGTYKAVSMGFSRIQLNYIHLGGLRGVLFSWTFWASMFWCIYDKFVSTLLGGLCRKFSFTFGVSLLGMGVYIIRLSMYWYWQRALFFDLHIQILFDLICRYIATWFIALVFRFATESSNFLSKLLFHSRF